MSYLKDGVISRNAPPDERLMPISDQEITTAVLEFWAGRISGTQAAKHDKAFLNLLARELTELGWPAHVASHAGDRLATVAGHFRVGKSWDIVCRDSTVEQPRICVEFKSQVDSYRNNENNRYEEALGSGLDARAKADAGLALGFVFVICDEPASRATTKDRLPDLDPAFSRTSHIERRRIFTERIVEFQLNGRSLYDAASVLYVRRDGSWQNPENHELWLVNFADKLVRAIGGRSKH